MKSTIAFLVLMGMLYLSAPAQVIEQDSLALVAFYNSTGGPNWYDNSNWLTGPVSTWYGVTVEGERVTELIINSNNLAGVLPVEMGQLSALKSLGMSNDQQLTGEIPISLFQIPTLEWFGIGNCSNLVEFSLPQNQLTGPIPPEIGNLDSLQFLDLHDNQLTGPIPPELGNCSNLQELWLNDNQLTGTIPEEVSYLDNLQILNVNNNQLSGELPVYLSNLFYQNSPFYISLFVSGNQFSGPVPEAWGDISFLIDALNLSCNQFTSLPHVNSNWIMTFFEINDNKLTFESVESHYQSYQQGLYYFFDYYPQDDMLEEIDTALAPGSNYSIYAGTGGEFTNYKWYRNSELILESNEADTLYLTNVAAADSGIYYCQATNSLVNQLILYRNPVRISIDTGANVIKYPVNNLVSVYPNPAFDEIKIVLPVKAKCYHLIISTLNGGLVLKQTYEHYDISEMSLDIKKLEPGIYLLQIQTEAETYATKFIKNKRGIHY
ncbi:MAG: T9SS type A sorting domain-containing protein [Bacteroidales bacterium]|nr:T9SS type A sorting domain-containing protein [Bacteroidales bacterium]MCF8398286.1 T9SS type A sorting domain-containing protein [Bacteroidales bacterium]